MVTVEDVLVLYSIKPYMAEQVQNALDNVISALKENNMPENEADEWLLGNRIKQRLDLLHMSQHDLAKKCQITDVTMSRYIDNSRIPKGPVIVAIAKVLGVTTDWLLGSEDKK